VLGLAGFMYPSSRLLPWPIAGMPNMRTRGIIPSSGGLLPVHHGDEGRVVGGGGDHTGSAPLEFPLRSSISRALVSCFYVSAALLFATCRGTLYIVGFRSR
jgi:hypothetical protein